MRRVIRRRRQEAKTDYTARIELLKSGKTRLVVRKTNRYIIAQFVASDHAQDSVITGVSSKDLLAKGWPKEKSGSLKSLPAAYLTGVLLASVAKGKVKEAIVDLGLHRKAKKARLFALIKGVIDAGIVIPCNKEALPEEETLKENKSVGNLIDKIKAGL